jgi:hypothetical protein
MWDLWWTKWHWDRFLSEFFGFPLSTYQRKLLKSFSASTEWAKANNLRTNSDKIVTINFKQEVLGGTNSSTFKSFV